MSDDLQDQINAQIKAASSRQPEALANDENENINLPNTRATQRPARINNKGIIAIGGKTPIEEEDEIKPLQTFDLSSIELPKKEVDFKMPENAPHSIADLLHLEKEVAKNPPKSSPYVPAGKTAVPDNGTFFSQNNNQPTTRFYPSSVPQMNTSAKASIEFKPSTESPINSVPERTNQSSEIIKDEIQNEPTSNNENKDESNHIGDNLKTIDYSPKKEETFIRKLRTLKGDIAEAMQSGASLVSIAAAEADKRSLEVKASATVMPKTEKVPTVRGGVGAGTKIMALVLSFLLIGGGAFAVYYLKAKQEEPIVIVDDINIPGPLIPIQFSVPINTDEKNASYLRASFEAERKRNVGKINEVGEVIFLTNNTENPEVPERSITSSEFFGALGMRPPVSLTRTLDPHFMSGFHRFGEIESFLIFKTDTYDVARAGMLEWERTLEDEVGTFLRSPSDFKYATATDATINRRVFTDKVYKNLDTRVMLDDKGDPLFLYSFINRAYLVFVTNPETLSQIVTGLSARKVTK